MLAKVILTLSFSTPLFIFAEETVVGPGNGAIPLNWGNLTAMGALIVGLLFLVVYYVPQSAQRLVDLSKCLTAAHGEAMTKIHEIHAKNLDDARAIFIASLDKLGQREELRIKVDHDDHDKVSESLKGLTVQCAQVRGTKIQP